MGDRMNSALRALDENSVNQRDRIMGKGLGAFEMTLLRGRAGVVVAGFSAVFLAALLIWLYS
jgi:hypothetical protein